ncbi:MAG: hypothetical protein MUC97_09010 [Bernardetiaceae bacterium]|jgi:arsenate reductase-like glutaredoxin family protein|nr:hypothetical protein [Bernardetiaceae bacterium]
MIENHPNEVIVFYNSSLGRERKIFAYAQSNFTHVRAFDVATHPLRGTLLEEVAMRLNCPLRELIRDNDELPELGDDRDYIKLIQHTPGLLHTPIVISKDKAAFIGSPGDFALVARQ